MFLCMCICMKSYKRNYKAEHRLAGMCSYVAKLYGDFGFQKMKMTTKTMMLTIIMMKLMAEVLNSWVDIQ